MAFGYVGKIVRVNLSDDRVQVENQEEVFYRRYFGGRGFVSYFLLKESKPGLDPLSSSNQLIFAPGVVSGAPFSGSGRNSVGAKSPLTECYGDAEVGGFWGAELKHAGFDVVIVEGRAKAPVYLWVHDGQAEIEDAKHLWGKETGEVEEAIHREHKDRAVRVTQIGPSGERMVKFSCVINDLGHAAGRTGLGAVMGSKNLKAIAAKGHDRVKVANPEKLRELAMWLGQNLSKREVVGMAADLHVYGTGAAMDAGAAVGNLPYHNFRDGGFPNAEAISAQAIKNKMSGRMGTCFACSVACKKMVKIQGPLSVDPKDPKYGGPEYETLAAFGSNCGVDDLAAICYANQICQQYGLDTISAGATVAFGMECFEKGILTSKDTNGLELRFGNADAMVKATQLIALREGVGNLLADGVKKVGEKLGPEAEKLAVHVKGLEFPMHEPRLKKALGLGYAVSPTGADHCHNLHDTGLDDKTWNDMKSLGILERVPPEDFGPAKVRLFKYYTTWKNVHNCLVTCQFPPWSIEQLVELVNAVTGWNTTTFELSQVGERALNMTRAFNMREGFTANDDRLPDRMFHPQNVGPLSNAIVNAEQLQQAKRTYYGMMGWNPETGVPTRQRLEELDIGWVAAQAGIQ